MPSLVLAALLPLLASGVSVQGRTLAEGLPVAGVRVVAIDPPSLADFPCGADLAERCFCPSRIDGFAAAVRASARPALSTAVSDAFGYFSLDLDFASQAAAQNLQLLALTADGALAGRAPISFGETKIGLVPARYYRVLVKVPARVSAADVVVYFTYGAAMHSPQLAERLPSGEFRVGPFADRWGAVTAMAPGLAPATQGFDFSQEAKLPADPLVLEPLPPSRVSGRVLFEGKPVKDAQVVVDPDVCEIPVLTGADGSFSVGWGRGNSAYAKASKGSLKGQGHASAKEPEPLELKETASLEVTLVGPGGEPVSGGRVTVQLFDEHRRDVRVAVTDGNGRALLEGLSLGRGSVQVDGYRPTKDVQILLEKPGRVAVTVAVAPTVSITGVVLDPDANPLRGVRVSANESPRVWEGTSNPEGQFRIEGLLPGEYPVTAENRLYGRVTTIAKAPSEITLRYPTSPALEGEVVDRAGAPVPNVSVMVAEQVEKPVRRPQDSDRRFAYADQQGRFRLFLRAGVTYEVTVFRGQESGTKPQTVVSRGEDVSMKLVLPRLERIAGVVQDDDGHGLPDLEVFALDADLSRNPSMKQHLEWSKGLLPPNLGATHLGGSVGGLGARSVGRTKADGSFDFEAGTEMLVYAVGVGFQSDRPTPARPGSTDTIVRVATRPVGVGRVVDPSGGPVRSFLVNGKSFDAPDGRFRFPIPVGKKIPVEVTQMSSDLGTGKREFAPRRLSADVDQAQREVDLGEIRLERCFDIRGRLVSADGSPVRGAAQAYVDDSRVGVAFDRTGARGDFTLRCVPAVPVRVNGYTEVPSRGWHAFVHVTPSTPQPIVLKLLADGSLRVTITDRKTGAPLPLARLEALGPDRVDTGEPARESASSDAQGVALLKLIRPGRWDLNVRTSCPRNTEPLFPVERRAVVVAPEKQAEVTIPIACAD
ncbi:MAG TPA: carboxypeptidase regulatory-like domain-containing protein [Myxococcales bacterium]